MRYLRLRKSGTRDPFATSAAMASTSVVQTCEVFICYASEDKDFVEWLDRDLKRANVSTFLDSEQIVLSEWNENERDLRIRGAMTQARVVILVVSKAWVGKPYPMKELGWALLDYKSKLLPVFFGLTLSESRTTELIKQLVDDHGTDVGQQTQAVKQVHELGGIGSLFYIQHTSEPDFSRQVVKELCRKLNKQPLSLPVHLVGGHHRLTALLEAAHMEPNFAPSNDTTVPRVCLLWGMSGLGKSVLARELYNVASVSPYYGGGQCYVEITKKDDEKHIQAIQNHIAKRLGLKGEFGSIYEAQPHMAKCLTKDHTLLILDGVWPGQLTMLIGDNFASTLAVVPPTSRVIIVSQVKHLTESVNAALCPLEDLELQEQKELFCLHAFKGAVCPVDYEELIEKLVPATGGLPMALQVGINWQSVHGLVGDLVNHCSAWNDLTNMRVLDIWTADSLHISTCSALTSVQYIRVQETCVGLFANLPVGWSRLNNLMVLDFSGRCFTGPLPPQWSGLCKLWELHLANNQLSGPLPPQWSALSQLENLNLAHNQLSGPLPEQWSALSDLKQLDLAHNQVSGPLPAEWSALSILEGLDLAHNQVSGPLPQQALLSAIWKWLACMLLAWLCLWSGLPSAV
eukprot:jgi/Chrzof1/8093/UNPLg00138.t1